MITRGRLVIVAIVVVMSASGVGIALAQGGDASVDVAVTTGGDPLQSVSPYQLDQMLLQLNPPTSQASVTAGEAEQIAQASVNGDSVREAALADCYLPQGPSAADTLCWAVSLEPSETQSLIIGPGSIPGATSASDLSNARALTVELVLVDAHSGGILVTYKNNVPAQAPSS